MPRARNAVSRAQQLRKASNNQFGRIQQAEDPSDPSYCPGLESELGSHIGDNSETASVESAVNNIIGDDFIYTSRIWRAAFSLRHSRYTLSRAAQPLLPSFSTVVASSLKGQVHGHTGSVPLAATGESPAPPVFRREEGRTTASPSVLQHFASEIRFEL
ncbi:hypothetical protein M422DRAFT_250352 [Sphaerobolus stellatus SS14]|uniref:Uncharacterized protein n=1 Tax=Sphaerobolus stellatus (strain SS14) TaxID=990650 RepID=A0A0C9UTZ1_SPHS4|nr:hypothetical protein M422DRAFT_250352 [Sphaerobolus stellatus SS14]